MTWSLSASGHVPSAEEEGKILDVLRKAMKDVDAFSANVSTSNHGYVNLLEENEGEAK